MLFPVFGLFPPVVSTAAVQSGGGSRHLRRGAPRDAQG